MKLRVLFYVEPWIEKSLPAYRNESINVEQRNLAATLLAGIPDIEIHALIGEGIIYSQESFDQKKLDGVEYHVLSQNDLKKIFPNYKTAARANYHANWESGQLEGQARLYALVLGNFQPDVIVAFESATRHLQHIFPNSLVINQYLGPFSRYPFPRQFALDIFGLYKDSYPVRFREELNRLPLRTEHSAFMDKLRSVYFDGILAENDPTEDLYRDAAKGFEKVVMLPLQGSDYFAFEENHPALNQFDYICHTLDHISPNVGVLITEHTARERVVNASNIDYLKRRYNNFIYVEQFGKIKFHSQFVLRHVDGVVFTSSAVGLQAALLHKPVFQVGTFESFVSSGGDLTKVEDFLTATPKVNKDAAFFYLFQRFYIPGVLLDQPHFLADILVNYQQQKQAGKGFDFYRPFLDEQELLQLLLDGERSKELKEKGLRKLHAHSQEMPTSIIKRLKQLVDGRSKEVQKGGPRAKSPFPQDPGMPVHLKVARAELEIISFDIFDTLLVRPFHRPRMLFKYIEPQAVRIAKIPSMQFAALRAEIEVSLRNEKSKHAGYSTEIGLDEVYARIAAVFGLSEAQANEIMALELEAELALCRPRKSAQHAYREALRAGKTLILVSDTYLPRAFIERLLLANGYSGYAHLFLSSEVGLRKDDGGLFQHVLTTLKTPAANLLHVGDNPKADIERAAEKGLHTLFSRSTINLFAKRNRRYEVLYTRWEQSLSQSAAIGLAANRFFDDPATKGFAGNSHFDGDAYKLGYIGLGPLLLAYAQWLIEKAEVRGYSRLFFLSREGKIMKQVFDRVAPLYPDTPMTEYLGASRRAVMVPTMKSIEDILAAVTSAQNPMRLESVLLQKLGFSLDESDDKLIQAAGFNDRYHEVDCQRDYAKLHALLTALQSRILASASMEAECYLEYLQGSGILPNGSYEGAPESAIVDIGYSGTMQRCLSALTKQKLGGLYLGTHAASRDAIGDMPCDGFLFENNDHTDLSHAHPLTRYLLMLEVLLSSEEGSLVKFEKTEDGLVASYAYSENEKARVRLLKSIDAGILDFVEDFIAAFGAGAKEIEWSKGQSIEILLAYFRRPAKEDAAMMANIGQDNKIRREDDLLFVPADAKKLTRPIDEYRWKEGTSALLGIEIKGGSAAKKTSKRARMFSARATSAFFGRFAIWRVLRS